MSSGKAHKPMARIMAKGLVLSDYGGIDTYPSFFAINIGRKPIIIAQKEDYERKDSLCGLV